MIANPFKCTDAGLSSTPPPLAAPWRYCSSTSIKAFNDRYGHAAGDTILKRIVLDVMATTRMSDFTYRFGGEEFVVIADGLNVDDAWALAERMRRCVASSGGGEEDARLTVSIGIANCTREGRDYETLFDVADKRLYEAKAAGRNRVVGGEKGVRLVHSG